MNKLLICMPLLLFVFCAQLSAQKAQTGNQTAVVQPNGQNTNRVEFVTGAFAQQGGTKDWVEMGLAPTMATSLPRTVAPAPAPATNAPKPDGEVRFRFVETGRDEWSIYLYDQTRDVRIALDLWKKEVKYMAAGDKAYSKLYTIDRAFTPSN